jgi:hypothetical protein
MNSYTFKVVTPIFSWKFTMFQNYFSMFKTLKKNMWTSGFFCFKNRFSLSNVHQIVSIFLWMSIYTTKKDPCVQKSQKIKRHMPFFRFCYSNFLKHYYSFEFVIMIQSKVIDLTIM